MYLILVRHFKDYRWVLHENPHPLTKDKDLWDEKAAEKEVKSLMEQSAVDVKPFKVVKVGISVRLEPEKK